MSQTSPKGDGWPLSAANRCLFFIGITLAILFTFANPVFCSCGRRWRQGLHPGSLWRPLDTLHLPGRKTHDDRI